MLRHDSKRRNNVDHRRTPAPSFKDKDKDKDKDRDSSSSSSSSYPHRLNFYSSPPTADITLEQFEQWAIDRLKILAELEACSFRNRSPQETALHMRPLLDKYLPLDANSSGSSRLFAQRQKDHYGHFILRLAFASTENLRQRFARVETMLFRMRMGSDDPVERAAFVASLEFERWEALTEEDMRLYGGELAAVAAAAAGFKNEFKSEFLKNEEGKAAAAAWFKVDWGRVPELVEARKVFVRGGKAYVPAREQSSLVIAEFTSRLERQLELTARALPKMDEDDRLTPILNHLSKNFVTPDAAYVSGSSSAAPGAHPTAASIPALAAQHFPACMFHLNRSLQRDAHLKHFGRLQYTLFLKGIGLSLDECLVFWRSGFHRFTDDVFNREYRYNVRHAYGDVGGDANRRGGGHGAFGCQRILTEHLPGPGDAHGCPYRHFDMENLTGLLQAMGVGVGAGDGAVLRTVKEDREHQKYHIACNRVFEHLHKAEMKKAKDEGIMTAAQLETIVHPNEYFKRSYVLKSLAKDNKDNKDKDVNMA